MREYIWLCLKIQYRLFCIYSDPGRGAKRGIDSPFPSAYAPQSHAGIVHTAAGYLCSGSKTGLCSSFFSNLSHNSMRRDDLRKDFFTDSCHSKDLIRHFSFFQVKSSCTGCIGIIHIHLSRKLIVNKIFRSQHLPGFFINLRLVLLHPHQLENGIAWCRKSVSGPHIPVFFTEAFKKLL